ncbi:MAG: HNH endonuclease [Nitrospirae bacterium]|nr:MAG: HNH endonuclease [Nitrospirota bacterium]
MAFPRDLVSKLLARCHRRCCVCHRFCGIKIETDHIVPKEQGGSDDIENAIPVCFECHAEIHSYNDQHPRGRKFLPDELRQHKEQWLKICDERPDVLVSVHRAADVGPLQALIDELALNGKVAARPNVQDQGARFHDAQLRRAIEVGSIAILRDEIREAVLDAYVAMDAASQIVDSAWRHPKGSNSWAEGVNEAPRRIKDAQPQITKAQEELLKFLATESPVV